MAGTPPSSRVAQFRVQTMLSGWGIGGEAFDVVMCNVDQEPADGRIYTALVGLNAGDIVTNIVIATGTAGAGTVPTLVRLGIASAAGTMVAVTADVKASAVLTTADNIGSLALTAPYTVTSTGAYQLCFVLVGTWGTTQMVLLSYDLRGNTLDIGSGPLRVGNSATGNTDLPAVGVALPALSAPGVAPWLGWS